MEEVHDLTFLEDDADDNDVAKDSTDNIEAAIEFKYAYIFFIVQL